MAESDCLFSDVHVNKRKAYKDKCVTEAQIQLAGAACGLMELFMFLVMIVI